MNYQVEAKVVDNVITLPPGFRFPQNKQKIMISFDDVESIDYALHEVDEKDVSEELLELSSNALKKSKSLFTNI